MMQETLQELLKNGWRQFKKDTYSVVFTVLLLALLLGYGGYKAHQWYRVSKESKAQKLFAQALTEYKHAFAELTNGAQTVAWQDIALAFEEVTQKHQGTTYSLYAQAFEADIKARQGQLQEAITQLEGLVATMAADAPGYYFFKTKIALLTIDAQNVQVGLDQLHALTQTGNAQADTAAFFLGLYYWTHDDVAKAQEVWKFFDATQADSPWAQIVQAKLLQVA
ncbi:MAG: tetratricopeptide repeat protein [Candidatus Babeliales bacterium]|jgi:hypothetical protein